MARLLLIGLVFFLPYHVLAQGRIGATPAAPRQLIGGGFGSVVFPGTGVPRGVPNVLHPGATTHAQRLGASISGYPGYTLGPRQQQGRHGGGIVPVAVPVFVGGYGYGYQAPPPAPVTVIQNTYPTPPPTVIVNNSYVPDRANPVMRDYTQEDLPPPEAETIGSYQAPIPSHPEPPPSARRMNLGAAAGKPTIYLLAFRDGSVFSSLAYWVEGETLHYITTKHNHNRASLSLVDREVSSQLNEERGVDFQLPAAIE